MNFGILLQIYSEGDHSGVYMEYQEIKARVKAVLEAGGFPPNEPLDSVRVISGSSDGEITTRDRGSFASVLAWLGEWDRAEAVALSIENDPSETGLALAVLAQRLAAAELLERSEAVARSIPNSDDRSGYMVEKATALLAIASKFLDQNRAERALAVLDEAEVAIKQLQHADHLLASLLGDLASLYTRTGQVDKATMFWDEAIGTAQTSIQRFRAGGAPNVDSWKALAIIAEDLFSIGDNTRAERAMALIDNKEWRERAHARIRK